MPTYRARSTAKRKRSGLRDRAIIEYLMTGHWWTFLLPRPPKNYGPNELSRYYSPPDDGYLRDLWGRFQKPILERVQTPWAQRYLEQREQYDEWLINSRYPVNDVQDEAAVGDGCWFDPMAADRVVCFYQRFLRVSHGEEVGALIRLMDWQIDYYSRLYGWMRESGYRRYTYSYKEIPKKNGKSTGVSGGSIYHLVGDGEQNAEVYSSANDRDQASIVFREMERMINAAPDLRHLKITPTKKEIWDYSSGSKYQALSRDVPTKEGINPSFLCVDELHAHKKSDQFDALRYGGAARRQPLTIVTTTAGEDTSGPCWAEHIDAREIIAGRVIDWSVLPMIYGIDEERIRKNTEIWKDRKVWFEVNPSLGVVLPLSNFEDDFKKALRRPDLRIKFKRYRLNIWGEKTAAAISMQDWQQCVEVGRKLELDSRTCVELLRGRECVLGVDLASRVDLASVTAIFEYDEYWIMLSWHFAPEERVRDREQRDVAPYRRWANDGWLNLTPGFVTNYAFIQKKIIEIGEWYRIKSIGFDPWNATQMQTELTDEGFECIEVKQIPKFLSDPTKEIIARSIAGTLAVAEDPLLTWQAGNMVVRVDQNENVQPDKDKSTKRIDGIAAGVTAGYLVLNPAEEALRQSAYNDDETKLCIF